MAPVFSHGDLRLYLLSLLDEGPRHGYDIMQALSDRTGGTYTPSAGTIYPRLAKLEEEGLVTKTVDGRKTVYEITDAGRAEVAARTGDLEGIEAGLTDSVRLIADEVRGSVREAMKSLRADLAAATREERASASEAPRGDDPRMASREQVHRADAAINEFRAQVRSDLRSHVARGGELAANVIDDLMTSLDGVARDITRSLRSLRDETPRTDNATRVALRIREGRLFRSGGPDLLVVGHRLAERDHEDRPMLPVRETRRHRAGEELADGFAESSLAGADDEESRVDLLGEMLHGQRGVADELADAPTDAVAVQQLGCLRLHQGEIVLARGHADVDRGGVDISVRILVCDEPRDVDVHDDQRGAQELGKASRLLEHAGREAGHHPRQDSAAQGGDIGLRDGRGVASGLRASWALGCFLGHVCSPFRRRVGAVSDRGLRVILNATLTGLEPVS